MLGLRTVKAHFPSYPSCFAVSDAAVDDAFGEPGEIGLVLQDERECARFLEEVLLEPQSENGKLLVDIGELRLVLFAQIRAAADERLVGLLEEPLLLPVQVELVPLVVHRLDTREELLVEKNLVVMGGLDRRYLLRDRLQLVARVRGAHAPEDVVDAREEIAARLERLDRVGEGRRAGIPRDRGDFLAMQLHRFQVRRLVVLGPDLLERRSAERGGEFPEQRILRLGRERAEHRRNGEGEQEQERLSHGFRSSSGLSGFAYERAMTGELTSPIGTLQRDTGKVPERSAPDREVLREEDLAGELGTGSTAGFSGAKDLAAPGRPRFRPASCR